MSALFYPQNLNFVNSSTVSRSEGIEKRPDGVKPFGRAGATGYYNFRSFD
jgi:hypothetical protein